MKETMLHDYVRQRMSEHGHANYLLRHRHFILEPNSTLKIDGQGELYVLVGEPAPWVRITSLLGTYDTSIDTTNELNHEHTGVITLENTSSLQAPIQLLQATPKNTSNA